MNFSRRFIRRSFKSRSNLTRSPLFLLIAPGRRVEFCTPNRFKRVSMYQVSFVLHVYHTRRLILLSPGENWGAPSNYVNCTCAWCSSKLCMIHVWYNWHVRSRPFQISLFSSSLADTLFGH